MNPKSLPFSKALPGQILLSKILLFVLSLLPLARAALRVLTAQEVNPVEFITRSTGTWTLVFLLLTLTITPLRKLTGWNSLQKLRRMLGLFAFCYGSLHFLTYFWLDQAWVLADVLRDVVKRPFVTVGFTAFVLMCPLALTSTDSMMRRLKRNWGRLHRAIYLITGLGVLHYLWLVKRDLSAPLIYAGVLGLLLGVRLWGWLKAKRAAASAGARLASR